MNTKVPAQAGSEDSSLVLGGRSTGCICVRGSDDRLRTWYSGIIAFIVVTWLPPLTLTVAGRSRVRWFPDAVPPDPATVTVCVVNQAATAT